jgi:hypothetical protein
MKNDLVQVIKAYAGPALKIVKNSEKIVKKYYNWVAHKKIVLF